MRARLRGGRTPWAAPGGLPRSRLEHDTACDVVVIGAGITGSLVAQQLAEHGHRVCVLDRERPGAGSTSASTAMLMWEIDRTLGELADLYGLDQAAAVYKLSLEALRGLVGLTRRLGIRAGLRTHRSLYLAGPAGPGDLPTEHALRARVGLPGHLLDAKRLREDFGFDRPAAILSQGGADADPVRLARGLMAHAITGGVELFDEEVSGYDTSGTGITVETSDGRQVEAKACVLATGYVMPDFVRSTLHRVTSSWALATAAQPGRARWRDDVLIWEDADPYLYARTTPGHRVIVGGEDSDTAVDPGERDQLIPAKTAAILAKAQALWPPLTPSVEYAWSGHFGQTRDGLPLIGPVTGWPGFYAAYGYGGNGITFSHLAARAIAQMLAGHHESWHDYVALDRAP